MSLLAHKPEDREENGPAGATCGIQAARASHVDDAVRDVIYDMLREDERLPQQQRRNIKTIYRVLHAAHGYTGSYSSVARYSRSVQIPRIEPDLRIVGDADTIQEVRHARCEVLK